MEFDEKNKFLQETNYFDNKTNKRNKNEYFNNIKIIFIFIS